MPYIVRLPSGVCGLSASAVADIADIAPMNIAARSTALPRKPEAGDFAAVGELFIVISSCLNIPNECDECALRSARRCGPGSPWSFPHLSRYHNAGTGTSPCRVTQHDGFMNLRTPGHSGAASDYAVWVLQTIE